MEFPVRARSEGREVHLKSETKPCPSCGAASPVEEVGSASGRAHCRCPKCGPWRDKNPAAVALGRLGAEALNKSLTDKEKSDNGARAADARWRKYKLAQNVTPNRRPK